MNSDFLKRQGVFLAISLLFTLFLFGVHWYLLHQFYPEIVLTIDLWMIYAFQWVTVLIVFSVINYKYSVKRGQEFSFFMGATLFKMILSLVFLLPLFIKSPEHKIIEAFNFFIPYFLFLAFEIFNIVSFLKDE